MNTLVRGMAGVALALTAALAAPAAALAVDTQPMYRLYNPNGGEHFYTADASERDHLVGLGWRNEGTGWMAPTKSKTPVYRLYNRNGGDHHYTTSAGERDLLVEAGWKSEGIGWYSDDNKSVPLYRQYNRNAKTGAHNFTTSTAERDMLIKSGWRDEGIGWYGVANVEDDVDPIVTPQSGCLIGEICDALSREPVEGAHVTIYSGDTVVCEMYTDANGRFEAELPLGKYRIVVTKSGYYPLEKDYDMSKPGDNYIRF